VEGAANEAVIELLAAALNVSKNKISIVAGETHSQKVVSVMGITAEQIDDKLKQYKSGGKHASDDED
jgi:uncharacterized protein YggU (UPF0235/DUF167 family)